MNIKILKDTPFDRAGASIPIKEFRLKYNYICSKDTTDDELLNYLRAAHEPGPKGTMAEFFAVDEPGVPLPLEFIYNGLLYVKQLSGLYHLFIPGSVLDAHNCVSVGSFSITQADNLFRTGVKFKKLIWYCTDNVHRKL